jgi:hypothetical protein
MTKSMWDAEARQSIRVRVALLDPLESPRWGRFTPHAMIVHLIDSARMALGTLPVRRSRGAVARIIRLPGPRHFFVYVLPFPRNAPTARELLTTAPGDWDADVATFLGLVNELAGRAANRSTRWPEHPFFGPLTRKDWGVLGYRHTDHHLRQFGA